MVYILNIMTLSSGFLIFENIREPENEGTLYNYHQIGRLYSPVYTYKLA